MKRLPNINLKRLSILNKPTRTQEITTDMSEAYDDQWLLKAEKINVKKIRNWRQQLAS